MNILITGSKGQLGNELRVIIEKGAQGKFFFEDVDTLDITDTTQVENYFLRNGIAAVINGAAYTAVDKAESDTVNAYKVNESGVKVLSQACCKHNAFMLHISTDYVFDGDAATPYTESVATNPQSVYGASKLAGEKAMIESGVNGAIVRTSWLYSPFGNNFVKTMLRLAKKDEASTDGAEIKVVDDQTGSPTYAADLADVLLRLLARRCEQKYGAQNGVEIYNYANSGYCSWAEFAAEIMRLSGLPCKVSPITTAEYPTLAARPKYSVLDTSKIKTTLGIEIPTWQSALERMLGR
jgi:dTDP-4-dehydrorhamnose reductase